MSLNIKENKNDDYSSIECINSFNYISITIDKNLNWQYHINSIVNKISKNIGILNKLFIPENVALYLQLLYSQQFKLWDIGLGYRPTDRLFKLQKNGQLKLYPRENSIHTQERF